MGDTEFENGRYLSRSWRMMTQDKGWYKPILVLALCCFVPVAGPIAVLGYALSWARLTAWGVDSAPKQTGVDVGGCFKAGWYGFVVALVWSLVLSVAEGVVMGLLSFIGGPVESVLSLAVYVLAWLAGLLVLVALVRTAVYERIGAGFGVSQVWAMATHDFSGLMRVLGIELLALVVGGVVGFVLVMAMAASLLPVVMQLAYLTSYADSYGAVWALDGLLSMLSGWLPALVLVGYVFDVISCVFELLVLNAVALWMRQFNVAAWGAPSDPVPLPTAPVPAGGAPAPVVPVVPVNSPTPAPMAGVSGYQAQQPTAKEALPMDYKVDNGGDAVTPPTPKDLYVDAADSVTAWTSEVEPTPEATDHLEYKDDPTVRPATADDHGVTAPTPKDLYVDAADRVATWPEVDLPDSTVEAADEEAADKPEANAAQTPVTAPTPKDLYVDAADSVTAWTSEVEPTPEATDHLEYKDDPTVRPATADDHGVTAPTPKDLYVDAADSVTDWTSVVEPTPDATDHLEYTPKPTVPPASADEAKVTPLIKHDDEDEQ